MAALYNRAGQYIFILWFLLTAALRNRTGHCIFVLWFLSSFFLSFFLLYMAPYGKGVADADIIFLPCSLLRPPYLIGQAIIFLSCGLVSSLSIFFFSSPNLTRRRCLPYFHTWSGLSANLEFRSEMCFTRLAENTGL